MTDTETRKELSGKEIKELISTITANPGKCGFEVYVITKSNPRLKKMGFVENRKDILLQKLKKSSYKLYYLMIYIKKMVIILICGIKKMKKV